MSRPIPPNDKTRNCRSYNKALKRRGALTVWFDTGMVWMPPTTGKRGRQPQYSDAPIQTCLTLKVLYGMALPDVASGDPDAPDLQRLFIDVNVDLPP
ncbi:putative transposase [Citreicella sp. 357]|nr:putative transposase [Citreicella sp. 357]